MTFLDTASLAKDLMGFLQYPLTIALFYLGLPRFAFTDSMLRAAKRSLASFADSRSAVTELDVSELTEGQYLERVKVFANFEFGQPLGFTSDQITCMSLEEKIYYRLFIPIIDRRVCQFVVVFSTLAACVCSAIIAGIFPVVYTTAKPWALIIWLFCVLTAVLPLLFIMIGRFAEAKLVANSKTYADKLAQSISKKAQAAMLKLAKEVISNDP